jgi:hypothetical protein
VSRNIAKRPVKKIQERNNEKRMTERRREKWQKCREKDGANDEKAMIEITSDIKTHRDN